MKRNTKGAADMMVTVIFIVILLFFLVYFVSTVNDEFGKRIEINLRESEIQKMSNTYNLLNLSLSNTWHISGLQTIFNSADQTFLCGYDDFPDGVGDDVVEEHYIYKFEPTKQKDIKGLIQYISDRNAGTPETSDKKYFLSQPATCYQLDSDVLQFTNNQFYPYTLIKNAFTVNNIITSIDTDNMLYDIGFVEKGVSVYATEKIQLRTVSGSGSVEEDVSQNTTILTEFPLMADYTRKLIFYLATFSDKFMKDVPEDTVFDEWYRVRELNADKFSQECPDEDCDKNAKAYFSRIINGTPEKTGLDFIIRALKQATLLEKTRLSIRKSNFELMSPVAKQWPAFGHTIVNGGGLMLHYNYTITLTESNDISDTSSCSMEKREPYLDKIEEEVAKRQWVFDSKLVFGDMEFTNEEMTAFVSAIMQRESNWNPQSVSWCGAAGLGQMMPDTARRFPGGSPLNVPRYAGTGRQCADFEIPVCNSNTKKCDLGTDERFDPSRNIEATVDYIHFLIDYFVVQKDYTDSPEDALRLVAAGYNAGEGAVDAAVQRKAGDKQDVKYSEIESDLPQETQDYVNFVTGHYVCFGGTMTLTGGLYYYHDQEANKFTRRPISMQLKVEDYLPAIDCSEQPYSQLPLDTNEKRFFNSARFFSYQSEPLQGTVSIKKSGTGEQESTTHDMTFGDIVCCGSRIWSCNIKLSGMQYLPQGTALAPGDIVNYQRNNNMAPSDVKKAATDCDDAINFERPSSDIAALRSDILCTDEGFIIVQAFTTNPTTPSPPPASDCANLDENQCRSRSGCYFSDDKCGNCAPIESATCPFYNNNPDACDQCSVAPGDCWSALQSDNSPICVPN